MHQSLLILLLCIGFGIALYDHGHDSTAIHFQIYRRGSRFSHNEPVNLTFLHQILTQVEDKYSWTYRETQKNALTRRWKPEVDEIQMLDRAGLNGTWYFLLEIGQPAQSIEVDLDMLSPDFYSIMTTADGGSKFDAFFSSSHVSSQNYVHPSCRLATDVFHVGGKEVELEWPICQASHSTRHTLYKSGAVLGLAPYSSHRKSSLSRLDYPCWLQNLYESGLVTEWIWSVALLDSTTGVLTLGGTVAKEMEAAKTRPELELKYMHSEDRQTLVEEELNGRLSLLGQTTEQQFKWLEVHGSAGWWTGLIGGIWINGVKVMKNQPFLLDINSPFILAPPQVFEHFYESISGSKILKDPHNQFAVFPCLNSPQIMFELAGWRFPSMHKEIREDAFHGPAGGPFSLGKMNDLEEIGRERDEAQVNSGLCIGAVVKTSMGGKAQWANSGMKGVWILGEPFFRGMGIAFDSKKDTRIGFRSY